LPKNGLEAALSTQICSLSEKSEAFCFVTITGGIQLFWSAMISGVRAGVPSIRETATASKPLKASSERMELKFEVRLA
jgi:hypothetical protein